MLNSGCKDCQTKRRFCQQSLFWLLLCSASLAVKTTACSSRICTKDEKRAKFCLFFGAFPRHGIRFISIDWIDSDEPFDYTELIQHCPCPTTDNKKARLRFFFIASSKPTTVIIVLHQVDQDSTKQKTHLHTVKIMETFELYHSEFRDLVRQIDTRFHAKEDATELVQKCEDILLQLKIEARVAPDPSTKQERTDIFKACKMQLESYKTINEKQEIFFDSSVQKQRMVNQQDQVSRQNERLKHALRSLNETEEIGKELGNELGKNRETIQRAKGNVDEMASMTGQAKGLVKSMMKRWF